MTIDRPRSPMEVNSILGTRVRNEDYKSRTNWVRMYLLLLDWTEERGTHYGPYEPDGHPAGELTRWVGLQRGMRTHPTKKLRDNKQALLERIPEWEWDHDEADWAEGFPLVSAVEWPLEHRQYIKRWIGRWRSRYDSGHPALTGQRVAMLKDLPGWNWHDPSSEWGRCHLLLKRWQAETGSCHVPVNYKQRGKHWEGPGRLSGWVVNQLKCYDSGDMTASRIDALESIPGWTWSPPRRGIPGVGRSSFAERELRWRLDQRLVDRVDTGTVVVDGRRWPCDILIRGKKIVVEYDGWFWHKDRVADDLRKTSDLESAGWTVVRVREKPLEYLSDLDVVIPQNHRLRNTEDLVASVVVRLGCKERLEHSNAHDQVNTEYSTLHDVWYQGYERLIEHIKNGGDASPHTLFVADDGYKLGSWVNVQRRNRNQGRLAEHKAATLEKLPGWRWGKPTVRRGWEAMFGKAKEYFNLHGEWPIVSYRDDEGAQVGRWCATQRERYRAGKLDAERIQRLDQSPEWQWSKSKSYRSS